MAIYKEDVLEFISGLYILIIRISKRIWRKIWIYAQPVAVAGGTVQLEAAEEN